ncbi:hypothetical protein A0O34_00365 [Chryseobacterium glaciei]|uniref:Uncharacterized protein n=1 Tax=Chryseobacterium glaciei TaxID=1685010 RepID=A0A172XQ71_9FLAO|nr:hypothetical protein A0O34_00365 [Chryseobacterium glaciei]
MILFKIILKELTKSCGHIKSIKQIRIPKLFDLELVVFNITAEYMSINSELKLFRCIPGAGLDDKIEQSVYNKRKRNLFLLNEYEKPNEVVRRSQLKLQSLNWEDNFQSISILLKCF